MSIVIKARIIGEPFTQVVNLIDTDSQVLRGYIERGLKNAHLIAYIEENGEIISTATLKNPNLDYRDSVFIAAGVDAFKYEYPKELAYIATLPTQHGKGYSKRLLQDFFPYFGTDNVFTTTQDAAIIHLLTTYGGFSQLGEVSNKALTLLVYKGAK